MSQQIIFPNRRPKGLGPGVSRFDEWDLSNINFSQLFSRRAPAPGYGNIQQVMASPPTITLTQVNPLTGGQLFNANNLANNGPASNTAFALTRADRFVSGASFPDNNYIVGTNVSYNAGASFNILQAGVHHNGSRIAFLFKGLSSGVLVKVNDQYASLTQTTIPQDGNLYYLDILFGGTANRRIDILTNNPRFGGAIVAQSDSLLPAQIRGPKVAILGDSFGEPTGSTNIALGFPNVFAEYMGFDDVLNSCIGGSGVLAGQTYLSRLATDIYPFSPRDLLITGLFNDQSSALADIQQACTLIINDVRLNLPNTRVIFAGPFISAGPGYNLGYSRTRPAIAAAVAQANSPMVGFIDILTSKLTTTPQSASITAQASNGAGSLSTSAQLIQGATYQWADGTRFFVKSVSGLTATIDNNFNTQKAGATFTQVGGGYLRGNGKVGSTTGNGNADVAVSNDGIHPTDIGHFMIGTSIAAGYANL